MTPADCRNRHPGAETRATGVGRALSDRRPPRVRPDAKTVALPEAGRRAIALDRDRTPALAIGAPEVTVRGVGKAEGAGADPTGGGFRVSAGLFESCACGAFLSSRPPRWRAAGSGGRAAGGGGRIGRDGRICPSGPGRAWGRGPAPAAALTRRTRTACGAGRR